MIGNVVGGIVVIVGFIVGIAIVGLAVGLPGAVAGYVFVLGVVVITGSIGVPIAVLNRTD